MLKLVQFWERDIASQLAHFAGLLFDRQWVIVAEDSGRFQSQRATPQLAQITTHLPEAAFEFPSHHAASQSPESDGLCLTMSHDGREELKVPLAIDIAALQGEAARQRLRRAHVRIVAAWLTYAMVLRDSAMFLNPYVAAGSVAVCCSSVGSNTATL